jgi:GTP-binding protein
MKGRRRAAEEVTALPALPPRPGARPLVAIVGRPNVGKSTLFNRIVGKPLAIVEDEPGVTRDRHYADADAFGTLFTLVDTGGFDPDSDDPIPAGVRRGVKVAIEEADVIVCVFDGIEGVTPSDAEAVKLLRRTDKPVLWVANKVDKPGHSPLAAELYRLGIGELMTVSAQHGRGVSDLLDAIAALLPEKAGAEDDEADRPIRVALVGRPNVGKSSIVNRFLGTDRLLVDDRPGTTRDAIDSHFQKGGNRYVLVDTAGMRRKKSVDRGVERWSVLAAVRALDRCDVAVLVMDASEGPAEQEAKVLGLAVDRGLGIVLAVNKWDLTPDREDGKRIEREVRDKLAFVPWAPLVQVSAKTGRGTARLLETVAEVQAARSKRVGTGELNRFFKTVLDSHPPPTQGGRSVRLYFVTQTRAAPPTFMVSTNFPADVHFSYRRYVINQLRKAFGFEGTPLIVHYKHKNRKRGDG